jgi:hypothetical protein
MIRRNLWVLLLLSFLFFGFYSQGNSNYWKHTTPLPGGQGMFISDTPQPPPTQAVRLIFEYEGDQVRLVTKQPVEMVVTGFDITQMFQAGYYIDARDANDQTLVRVPARNAFDTSTEVFPEQPGEPITRVDMAAPRGAFTVVVPIPERANHVTIVQIAPSRSDVPSLGDRATSPVSGSSEVTDLASFSLESPLPLSRGNEQ